MLQSVTFDDIASMAPEVARAALPTWLLGHVNLERDRADALEVAVRRLMQRTPDDEVRTAFQLFGDLGSEYRVYPAQAFARALSRVFIPFLVPGAVVEGLQHLRAAVSSGPTLLLSNHLSYVDTQVTDALLVHSGEVDLADRILAVAGPKVYGTTFRRMASLGLNTLKTAQSSSLAHNEAGLTPREVGRIAVETVHRAEQVMAEGGPVLVYAEGARSRDRRLQPFLKGVTRYAAGAGVSVVPVAVSGTDRVFPIDALVMRAAPVRVVFGEPVPASLGRGKAVELCWHRVADGLDEAHRPAPGTAPLF